MYFVTVNGQRKEKKRITDSKTKRANIYHGESTDTKSIKRLESEGWEQQLLRVWRTEPAVGQRLLRHLDLLGMLRQTSRTRGSPQLRQIRHHGQVEGHRAGENEGRRE